MSEIIEHLELNPPKHGHMEENMIGTPRDCPVCHGSGWFWMEDPVTTESVKKQCPHCDGKGQVVPYVFIRWGAPIRNEE
jgi:DnaJ-class molecular chaperone